MLLAASKEKPTLRKSPVSDLISQRGQLKPKLIAASKTSETKKTKPALKKSAGEKAVIKLALARQAEPVKALKKETLSQAPAPRTIAQTAKPVIIQPWKSNMAGITAASARPKKEESSAKNKMVLQEVEPAEMVEITENDGDHSNNIWQPGGRTYDGNGARSTLTFYLKELNRRLRRAWIPNKDQDQKTALYFRISRSGRLMMVKLVRSSGQAANDEAAMKAITACAPFAPLPSDYPYSFLDLNYTFSYKFDQLSAAEDATQL
jgi:TonB family protein